MPEVVYQLRIAGNEAVAQALQSLGAEAVNSTQRATAGAKSSTEASEGWVKQLNNAATSFQSLSRDIDTVGGQSSAMFLRAANDVAGVIATIGTGGLMGAVAVLGSVIGRVSELWTEQQQAAEKATKAAAEGLKAELELFDMLVDKEIKRKSGGTEEDYNKAIARLDVQKKITAEAEKQLEVAQAASGKGSFAERISQEQAILAASEEVVKQQAKQRELSGYLLDIKKELVQKDIEGGIAAANLAAAQKEMIEIAMKRAKYEADYKAALREEQTLSVEAYFEAKALAEKKKIDDATDKQQLLDREKQYYLDKYGLVDSWANAIQEEEMKQYAELNSMMVTVSEHEDEVTKAKERDIAATITLTEQTLYANSANAAFGVQALLTSQAVSVLSSNMALLGTINRENWRDMLSITDDTVASWASQAQAAMASIAQQAGSKSVFEQGEYIKESALALGSLALNDYKGAALHEVSAVAHQAAGVAYAAIGGGAVVGAVGIGAMRGEGGVFGLTKQERDMKDRQGGGRTAQQTAGPSMGKSYRGSDTTGNLTVNIIYEAGSVNAGDDNALAKTMAKGTKALRNDGFANRSGR